MLDFFYPRQCVHCDVSSPSAFRYLCWDCYSDIPRIEPPFCSCCGDPVAGDVQHDYLCYSCSRKAPAYDAARSAVRYEGAAGTALRALKYNRAVWLAHDLARWLVACVLAEYSQCVFDGVCAVPLFAARFRERGYNQSELLAAELARGLGIRHLLRVVRRVRPTITQTGLTAPQRAVNVHDAFLVGLFRHVEGMKILLVDDVMTTGATVNACANALKKGGAESIHVITVARG